MKQKLPTEWNLSDLGKKYNDSAFKKEREEKTKHIQSFARKWKKDTSYLTNAKFLKKALDAYAKPSSKTDGEGSYLFLMRQVETGNTQLMAAMKKYDEFSQKLFDEIRFFRLSLATIEPKYQKAFLKDADLAVYKNFLSGIFASAKYRLSEPEERILSLKSGVSFGNWDAMVDEIFAHESALVLTKGKGSARPKKKQTFNELIALSSNDCKRVRKSAASAIEKILDRNGFVVEKEFNSILENKKINDELRGYERADQARALANDISLEIVDTMTEVVTDHFKISRDYYALKAQLLKQDVLHYNERNVSTSKSSKKYSYTEATDLVQEALLGIDPEFATIHKDMYTSGKIDVFPRVGKRGGAFCMYHNKRNPVYIMLNHTNQVRDILTLAHEMGHAIHGTLAKRENALNYDTPMFIAEIASTFCEGYAFELLIEKSSEKEKLGLYMQKIGESISTISRQVAAYNFERAVHDAFREKGYLPRAEIGALFKKHMKAYMGPAVLQDYGAENWWMYWSHFRSHFYVYAYASGLLIANGMRALLRGDKERWGDIKQFFYTGTSQSPQETFEKIGIDIADPFFWEAGMLEIKTMLKEAKKIAKKLGKI